MQTQFAKKYSCQFKDANTEVKASVMAVDLRDAASRFITTDVGMLLAKANSIPVDFLSDIPANFEVRYYVAQDGWSLQVIAESEAVNDELMAQSRSLFIPEGPSLNTILAALRFYQEKGMAESANRSERIDGIATNAGEDAAMTADQIDDLCQAINCSAPPAVSPVPLVIVRSTKDDEILVEASHDVRVVYLEDNETGDLSDELVELDGIDMWKQVFDASASDLSSLIPQLKLDQAATEA